MPPLELLQSLRHYLLVSDACSWPNIKRQERVAGGAASVETIEVSSPPPPRVTSRGRNANLPSKVG